MTPINSATTRAIHATVTPTAGQLDGSPGSAGAPLLPEPPAGARAGVDAGEAMAMLMIDSAFARRMTARDARTKAQSARAEAQNEQLDQMRTAADERYDAAKTDAWVQIGSGAVTVAGIGMGALGSRGGGVEKVGSAIAKGMEAGGNNLAKGIGGLHSAGDRHAADMAEASAKQHEYSAKLLTEIGEDWGDDVRAAKESVRKALDFLKEYKSTQSQTQAAALHRA